MTPTIILILALSMLGLLAVFYRNRLWSMYTSQSQCPAVTKDDHVVVSEPVVNDIGAYCNADGLFKPVNIGTRTDTLRVFQTSKGLKVYNVNHLEWPMPHE